MVALVIDSPYRSTTGRKPASAAVLYDFHNDAAGGLVVSDRYGNGPTLTIAGTEGTIWSDDRGWLRPNGTDNQATITSGHAQQDYIANSIIPALLTVGRGLYVHWRFKWPSATPSATEAYVTFGRSHSSSAAVVINTAAGKPVAITIRGLGASATSSLTFGSATLYTTGTEYSILLYLIPTAAGFDAMAWMDGVALGTLGSLLWTANSGSVPAASVFAYPDTLAIGANRGGSSSGSPTWSQRLGATNSAGTAMANVGIVAPAAGSVNAAAALALELAQYPRYVGEILASV
ncbi:MAG: hypothetical protein RJA36_3105 [Pseudomonadota bacterium]|jgi:hypothetical protein